MIDPISTSVQGKKAADSKFRCSFCNSVYASKGTLTRHVKKKHGLNDNGASTTDQEDRQEKKFSCSLCESTFTSKGNLTRHCNEKHSLYNDKAVPITCPACNETFSRHESLFHASILKQNIKVNLGLVRSK